MYSSIQRLKWKIGQGILKEDYKIALEMSSCSLEKLTNENGVTNEKVFYLWIRKSGQFFVL